MSLCDQELDEFSGDHGQDCDVLSEIKEENGVESDGTTNNGGDLLIKPKCHARSYQLLFEEYVTYLTNEMKVDSEAAEGKANEAFSTLISKDIDYVGLKSFTSHQLKYRQCLSQGDVVCAMRTLFKSRGILKMWAMEQFLRKLVAHYF